MENYSVYSIKLLPVIILLATLHTPTLNAAETVNYQAGTSSMQVAIYKPGRVYFRPGYAYHGPDNGTFWGGWHIFYRHGIRCLRKCLVDTWSGLPIRCDERCVY